MPDCCNSPSLRQKQQRLHAAGLEVHASPTPLLPCDPRALAGTVLDATETSLSNPFHAQSTALALRRDVRSSRNKPPANRLPPFATGTSRSRR